jgi:hypothetical protein
MSQSEQVTSTLTIDRIYAEARLPGRYAARRPEAQAGDHPFSCALSMPKDPRAYVDVLRPAGEFSKQFSTKGVSVLVTSRRQSTAEAARIFVAQPAGNRHGNSTEPAGLRDVERAGDVSHRASQAAAVSGLRVGDIVEVRSAAEILDTLDERGCTGSLPFMPEMLRFCNKRLTVYKRADKTCDTIGKTGGRRLLNTVHLTDGESGDGVRCDGTGHGGCEAGCLIFWNEAWLKGPESKMSGLEDDEAQSSNHAQQNSLDVRLRKAATARQARPGGAPVYRCQATQLKAYTTPLQWWDVRQYVRDLAAGNVHVRQLIAALAFCAYRRLVKFGVGYRLLVGLYNWLQSRRGQPPWPYIQGRLQATPLAELNLQPGELVRVKPLVEIVATLDVHNRNRGMLFAPEMVRFCGGTYKVLRPVHRIIDEKRGEMLEFSNSCVILQNVYCLTEFSERRVFCPRSIYPFWRDIWLERIGSSPVASDIRTHSGKLQHPGTYVRP